MAKTYRLDTIDLANSATKLTVVCVSDGYTAGVPDEAHFGLGTNTAVDVRVTLPPGSRGLATNGVIDLRNVPADRHLRLPA